jgi:ribosomal protein L19
MESVFNYFELKNLQQKSLLTPSFYIKGRKNRQFIDGFKKVKKFVVGDIIEFVFFYRSVPLIFSGICLAIKKKSFLAPDITVILRNVIMRVGIEVTFSYFHNRVYKLKFLDYKRKFYFFNKNKLYFIRKRLNRESKIDD